ncbi:MAG: glycosyltransferase [Candidatus Lokiarchaeota archaeon]|nr:glycosyltransferase [Candidatus Lokiarchaeota archaeon]
MKILLTNPDGGAFYYILRGFRNAFKCLGHTAEFWDGSLNTFDADIYIGSSGWPQSIPQDRTAKIILHVNPYGSTRLNPISGVDINESDKAIQWTVKQKPDFVFGYGLKGDVNEFWDNWINEFGIPVYGIPPAGDHIIFKPSPDPNFKCDLAYVGGYWPYKAINIDKYLEPARKKFGMTIYGWGGWNKRSGGPISDDRVVKLLSSAKICPCIHEPHTSTYGIDIPERVFKVPLCGSMAICDPSAKLHEYFPCDTMPMAKNTNEYISLIEYYLKHDIERNNMIKKQRICVLKYHTYLSRIKTIFAGLGLIEECIKIQKHIEDLVQNERS